MTDFITVRDGAGTAVMVATSQDGDVHSPHHVAKNVVSKFREAFETLKTPDVWSLSLAAGDIVQVDGNAVASSYLVISKDPLSVGETTLTSVETVTMPVEMAVGLSLSQRTLGQEFSVEFISDETPTAIPADVAISAIQQTTTTLSITTAVPHGLKPGMRFGVDGCADSRMNYPALVVATAPTATTLTATAGPGGTIPSVTAGPFASGSIFTRSSMGGAKNGASLIFENASATNGSFYVRSEAGDVLPSGTLAGNHALTLASTASVQAINAALTYAFQPTTEFRIAAFVDQIQLMDVPVDSVNSLSSRQRRTQVVPSHTKAYRVRFRCTNNRSLTRPVAQIISAAKTGTTTATVVTDVPHGLTTGDQIVAYGVRDATNFANLTAATTVASVVNATTFTVVWGSAVTATSYGGYVARVNGGNLMSALGAIGQVLQSVTIAGGIITAVGNAAWSGVLNGDYVNLVGVRNSVNGATLGIDGAYRVRDLNSTSLYLEAIGTTPTPADVGSTNCGGAVIKRTDLRVSFVRVLDFERQRVEFNPRASADGATALNVQTVGTSTVSISGTPGVNATSQDGMFWNDSTTNQSASATLTGTARDVGVAAAAAHRYAVFNAFAFADQAGTMRIECSNDNTTWRRCTADTAVAANTPTFLKVPVMTRYFRVVYVNGATLQTAFMLNTSFTMS